MIGLGVGTTVSYCRPGDQFRIYEIDPSLPAFVNHHFSYLRKAACPVTIVPGDARLSLEREPAQQFDLLIVDAFTSDAIPVHLLTLEAFASYQRHLQPEGVLAIHVSNRYFTLPPVIRAAGRHLGLPVIEITNAEQLPETWGATWMLVTRNRRFLELPDIARARTDPIPTRGRSVRAWTDDRASVLEVFTDWPWALEEARTNR